MAITWPQALAFRMEQQLLDPVGGESVEQVVQRLGGVPAKDDRGAELAVAVRRPDGRLGDLATAAEERRVITVFAYRGGVHYLAPDDGGAYLALRCAGRQWELKSWVDHYRLSADEWHGFRATVREALADGPLTMDELGAAVTRKSAYRHLKPVFADGAVTLSKPLTWQGDMEFGPSRDGRRTYRLLEDNPRWAGVWDLEDAGPHAITAFVRAFGPTTREHVHHWLGAGLSAGAKRLDRWLDALDGRLVEVTVDGTTAYVLDEHVDGLHAARPSTAVRLLPGHDGWVMGVSTKDEHVVPPWLRTDVTRGAYLVLAGGVVRGTWTVKRDRIDITWVGSRPPRTALTEEAARIAEILSLETPQVTVTAVDQDR